MTTARPTLAVLLAALAAAPGAARAAEPAAERAAELEPIPPLMDNSFLVEEAYNQEAGVVQQILTYVHDPATGGWVGTFTQEWPVPDQRNQLSYTLTLAKGNRPDGGLDFSDVLLNYRYQAAYQEGRLAFAPRLSAIVPSGNSSTGSGFRGLGLQMCLPVSTQLTPWLVAHSNLAATWVPDGKAGADRATWVSYSLGQSFVWLLHPRFNVLVEAVMVGTDRSVGGVTTREQVMTVSPGVRWGIDLPHDVQVVLGLAAPVGLGPSAGDVAVLGYLSVELPFWHPAAAEDAPLKP